MADFCRAFEENDTAAIEKGFTSYLRKTISIRDTNAPKERKENFYHGILLGLFAGMDGWNVKSNAESGEGYCDISVEVEDKGIGILIELKYAEKAAFDKGCREALKQINDRNYEETFTDNGMAAIRKYGIACYKKQCRVVSRQGPDTLQFTPRPMRLFNLRISAFAEPQGDYRLMAMPFLHAPPLIIAE